MKKMHLKLFKVYLICKESEWVQLDLIHSK